MVQKSILSFFSAKPARGAEGTSDAGGSRRTTSEDSPVKRSVKRRSRVIESDNEEEEEEVETSGEDGGRGKGPKEGENGRISEEEEEKEEEKENVMSNKVKKKTAGPKKGKGRNVKKEVTAEDDGKGDGDQNSDGAKNKVSKEKCEEEGEMEVEEGPEEESEMKDVSEDRSKKKELEEEEEGSSSSSSATSEKESQPPLSNSPGFSPETIPPLRRTAERQLKRKSGGMEEEQTVKKQKKQEEEEEEVKEEKAPQKEKTRKLIKSESEEEENMENSKKDDKKEDKDDDGTEGKKSSPAGRPKPAAFHSFFTAMKGSAGKNTPTETTSKAKEEENFSSPQKRKREEGRGKTATRAKIEEGKSEKRKESPKKKEDKKDDSEKTSTVDTFKEEKEEEEENEDARKSTKTNSPQKEEQEEKEKKEDKKITVNPFAQKTPGSAGDDLGAEYNPKKGNYHPIKDAFWKNGQKVPYLALAKTLEAIEETSGRLKIVEILANFLRSVIVLSPDDLLFCVYLCLNKVAPAFEGLELRIGSTILIRAIAQASGRSAEKIKADAERLGDLGVVAEMSRSNQRVMMQPAKLTVPGVFHKLKEIALMTGHASQAKKIELVKGMYVACRFCEAKYLIRSLGGKLRVGLAEQSVLQAIAQACYLTPPGQKYPPEVLDAGAGRSGDKVKAEIDEYALILKTTYCEFPSYDKIIPVLLKEGLEELPKHCSLTPGVPLKPMLAHPTTGISEVLKRFDNKKFTCEFKYDGERAQIHMQENGTINIYSRNQEDNTSKYPDIISRFKNSIGENVKSCVIDSEAVAWDREKKRILPFQVLSTRKKKDARESQITVQVCVFPFDLLYLNGEPLVREPFERRRALLRENFTQVEGEFVFAQSMDATNTEDIEEFLEESIKGNCEGLMVKTLDVEATYEIAKRSRNWLKLKKDYLDGVGDTIDAVVIGGYLGKGKRAGNYGGFLLACYDEDNEEYQSLCKIGTGFSDEDLSKHTEFFKKHIIQNPKSYYRYDSAVEPDHWFDAVQVWEVKCADLSISPVHKAAQGIVDPEKGISLRFPRFLRIRDDKNPEAATSASQIAELYKSQEQIKNSNIDAAADDEDYY